MESTIEELIRQQITKSTEKLEAAKLLLRENFIDDTISRAYYSIFHAASAVLLSKGITTGSHSGLKAMFGLHLIETGELPKEFGRFLNRLKDERENGDYDIFTRFEEEDAKEAVEEAEKFLTEMKKYLKKTQGIKF